VERIYEDSLERHGVSAENMHKARFQFSFEIMYHHKEESITIMIITPTLHSYF
jgi:hypothetical protein